jgi:ketosteroid isomerase-like protein
LENPLNNRNFSVMKKSTQILLLCMLGMLHPLMAAEDPAHQELRTIRTEIIDSIVSGDIEATLKHVHPDVVITWQNSEVCRGHQGLRDFFQRMGKASFKGYKVPPTPDELTILHGGTTGISFGQTIATYKLFGTEHEIKSRWTATLVKENGKWLLAGYHVSMNALDNPLFNAAKSNLYLASGFTLVAGLCLGILIGRRRR